MPSRNGELAGCPGRETSCVNSLRYSAKISINTSQSGGESKSNIATDYDVAFRKRKKHEKRKRGKMGKMENIKTDRHPVVLYLAPSVLMFRPLHRL